MPGASAALGRGNRYNIVVLGAGGVGKSALCVQYVQGVFVEHYDPTIMDTLMTADTVDGESAVVTLADTTGQAEFADHRVPYVRAADAVVFVYSVTDAASAEELMTFAEQVARVRGGLAAAATTTRGGGGGLGGSMSSASLNASGAAGGLPPFLVVGNKTDLEHLRQVRAADGERVAQRIAARIAAAAPAGSASGPAFVELSSKDRASVVAAWHTVVRLVRRAREGGGPASPTAVTAARGPQFAAAAAVAAAAGSSSSSSGGSSSTTSSSAANDEGSGSSASSRQDKHGGGARRQASSTTTPASLSPTTHSPTVPRAGATAVFADWSPAAAAGDDDGDAFDELPGGPSLRDGAADPLAVEAAPGEPAAAAANGAPSAVTAGGLLQVPECGAAPASAGTGMQAKSGSSARGAIKRKKEAPPVKKKRKGFACTML